jgi:hypothetical protein
MKRTASPLMMVDENDERATSKRLKSAKRLYREQIKTYYGQVRYSILL